MANIPVLVAPSVLCLYKEPDEFNRFISFLHSPYPVIKIDFSATVELTAAAAAALILFAHINSIQHEKNNTGCFCFASHYSQTYTDIFIKSGLIAAFKQGKKYKNDNHHFQCSNIANYAEHRSKIRQILSFHESKIKQRYIGQESEWAKLFSLLRTATSEMVMNVQHHAYPTDGVAFSKKPMNQTNFYQNKNWWYMFVDEEETDTLFLIVYDMGVGISESYVDFALEPRAAFYSNLEDAHIVQEAWQAGMSRFIGSGRGNGLDNIVKLVEYAQKSDVFICSGLAKAGTRNKKLVTSQLKVPLQGTLIECSLSLLPKENYDK